MSKLADTIKSILEADGTKVASPAASGEVAPDGDQHQVVKSPDTDELTGKVEGKVTHVLPVDDLEEFDWSDESDDGPHGKTDGKGVGLDEILAAAKAKINEEDDDLDEDLIVNPTTAEVEDPDGDETVPKKDQPAVQDSKNNGMGPQLIPVAAMGTYMKEEVSKLIESDSNVVVDRNAVKGLFEAEGQEAPTADFVEKAAKLFEETCTAKVKETVKKIVEAVSTSAEKIYEAKTTHTFAMLESYVDEIAKEWLVENKLAVESGIRTELAESFMDSLRQVFEDHYIQVPESKVNLLEALQKRMTKLEESASVEIAKGLETKSALVEAEKTIAFLKFSKGMTEIKADKLQTLAESVQFVDEKSFTEKLKQLGESVEAPTGKKEPLMEDVGKVILTEKVGDVPVDEIEALQRHAIQRNKQQTALI